MNRIMAKEKAKPVPLAKGKSMAKSKVKPKSKSQWMAIRKAKAPSKTASKNEKNVIKNAKAQSNDDESEYNVSGEEKSIGEKPVDEKSDDEEYCGDKLEDDMSVDEECKESESDDESECVESDDEDSEDQESSEEEYEKETSAPRPKRMKGRPKRMKGRPKKMVKQKAKSSAKAKTNRSSITQVSSASQPAAPEQCQPSLLTAAPEQNPALCTSKAEPKRFNSISAEQKMALEQQKLEEKKRIADQKAAIEKEKLEKNLESKRQIADKKAAIEQQKIDKRMELALKRQEESRKYLDFQQEKETKRSKLKERNDAVALLKSKIKKEEGEQELVGDVEKELLQDRQMYEAIEAEDPQNMYASDNENSAEASESEVVCSVTGSSIHVTAANKYERSGAAVFTFTRRSYLQIVQSHGEDKNEIAKKIRACAKSWNCKLRANWRLNWTFVESALFAEKTTATQMKKSEIETDDDHAKTLEQDHLHWLFEYTDNNGRGVKNSQLVELEKYLTEKGFECYCTIYKDVGAKQQNIAAKSALQSYLMHPRYFFLILISACFSFYFVMFLKYPFFVLFRRVSKISVFRSTIVI